MRVFVVSKTGEQPSKYRLKYRYFLWLYTLTSELVEGVLSPWGALVEPLVSGLASPIRHAGYRGLRAKVPFS